MKIQSFTQPHVVPSILCVLLNINRTNIIFFFRWNIPLSQTIKSSHKDYVDSQGKYPTKSRGKEKEQMSPSIDLSAQPYFATLQGCSSPNVPNGGLTSAGAEQILASWVALGPVIYLHPIEPLSSPLLPHRGPCRELESQRGPSTQMDGEDSASHRSPAPPGFSNNGLRVRNRLDAVGKSFAKAFLSSHDSILSEPPTCN